MPCSIFGNLSSPPPTHTKPLWDGFKAEKNFSLYSRLLQTNSEPLFILQSELQCNFCCKLMAALLKASSPLTLESADCKDLGLWMNEVPLLCSQSACMSDYSLVNAKWMRNQAFHGWWRTRQAFCMSIPRSRLIYVRDIYIYICSQEDCWCPWTLAQETILWILQSM